MPSRSFSKAELLSFEGAVVDDLIANTVLGNTVSLLFVGINPGLWTAAANAHFARPGNRFWPALHAAGILARLVDARAGMKPDDLQMVMDAGIGITNLVARASARADELTRDELRAGGEQLLRLVERLKPRVVAVLGLSAFRLAFDRRSTTAGLQPELLGAAELWVLPNPSGLNAHDTVATLAHAYRQAALAAGLVLNDN